MAKYPNDYISRQQLIDYANNSRVGIDANDIARFPAADVRENVRAEWEDKSPLDWYSVIACSNCGAYGNLKYNFCPNCGAEMRGKNNDG